MLRRFNESHTPQASQREIARPRFSCFGQQIEDVVVLTWEQVTVTSQAVTVRLGTDDVYCRTLGSAGSPPN